jgi:ketosteroid isomerase-like protein
MDKKWNLAVAAKDSLTVAGLYAEDGRLLVPNGPTVTGRKAIASWWGAMLRLPNSTVSFAPTTVVVAKSGDLAYELGSYRLSIDMPQGRVSDSGKTMVIWKKVGGSWQVTADMYSSERPLAPEAAAGGKP